MSSREKDVFSRSGPFRLSSDPIDWTDPEQRRAVVASLVRGVGAMERDRQEGREGLQALAPAWWQSFSFKLLEKLTEHGGAIYGAIYRFCPDGLQSPNNGPNYVVAFRGTNTGKESLGRDMKYNLMCLGDNLDRTSRFKSAVERVQCLVHAPGAADVWLAGHSLGSAMAMAVGKAMARSGYPLEAYLFNPPFVSLPVEHIKIQKLRQTVHIVTSVFKSSLAVILKGATDRPLEDPHFAALSDWLPHIFVNKNDPICSGYVGYFSSRRNMEEIGAGEMGRIATQNTIGSLIMRRFKPHDTLPSAHLTINSSCYSNVREAHSVKQWWDSRAQFERSTHRLRCS
ncbi:hypothetical protein SAY87_011804 [Trapa incisa]|uniref:Fungal lipase-like domain-containing protein n=1 Tax=Trapa incisa TaxID=236973 RepID=A0AAN7JIZ9_9MYRT|nr:hypothetical protein SAY87_011804 [Trapa incisa]